VTVEVLAGVGAAARVTTRAEATQDHGPHHLSVDVGRLVIGIAGVGLLVDRSAGLTAALTVAPDPETGIKNRLEFQADMDYYNLK